MAEATYGTAFFDFHDAETRRSAREMVPEVLRFVQPRSVVDVGCGRGAWLAEFQAHGVGDVLGIDGDYVQREKLLIEPGRFLARDLTQPQTLGRAFDLAMSLEVAEHLPAESAATFVAALTRLAPVVLFSAAVPHQGGDGHVNEQFPEYWQELFAQHHFIVVDALRARVWNNSNISYWYRQNAMFFVDERRIAEFPRLSEVFDHDGRHPALSRVHPDCYLGLYHELEAEVLRSQQLAMRSVARLREINLVAFPDWSQPHEMVADEIRELLVALAGHPQRGRITLAVYVKPADESRAAGLLAALVEAVVAASGRTAIDNPGVVGIGSAFGQDQWRVLTACMQGRATLPHEDTQAVIMSTAHHLPAFDVAAIRSGQPLVVDEPSRQ